MKSAIQGATSYYFFTMMNDDPTMPKIFKSTLITMLGVTFILNTHFYPGISRYQGGPVAGRDLMEMGIQPDEFVIYKAHRPSLDFYANTIFIRSESIESFDSIVEAINPRYVFTYEKKMNELIENGYHLEKVKKYDDVHISQLTLPFLNPATREESTRVSYLLELK